MHVGIPGPGCQHTLVHVPGPILPLSVRRSGLGPVFGSSGEGRGILGDHSSTQGSLSGRYLGRRILVGVGLGPWL